MLKKKWYNKRLKNWTGRDMVAGTTFMTVILTALCALPFVGMWIKEALD